MNVEDDRLSSLPDELIHKILSFTSIKHAIGMSVVSSRWRSIWTSMPYLNFSNQDFSLEFVSKFLCQRNYQTQVFEVKLLSNGAFCKESVTRILNYAFSHNVQQVYGTFPTASTISTYPSHKFPHKVHHLSGTLHVSNFIPTPTLDLPSLTTLNIYGITLFYDNINKRFDIFSKCPNLKNLSVGGFRESYFIATPTTDLLALTTLHLDGITLSNDNTDKCTGLFSKCPNLKNLSLRGFKVMGTNILNICHPRLSNLTLEHTYSRLEAVTVVAPQLKKLTIKFCHGEHLISAPGLTSLVMKDYCPLQPSAEGFCSLEKVDLFISNPLLEDVHKIVSLLQQLHNVKFLTLNLEILELLSSSTGLISHQPSPFANLKVSKFSTSYPAMVYLQMQAQEKATASLLDSFDKSGIFTMVSQEEIRFMRNSLSARKLHARLLGLLDQRKALKDSNKAHMEQGNAPMESHKAQVNEHWAQSILDKKGLFRKTMAQIKQTQIELRTKLQLIEGLWTELPPSKRPAMLATFSSVCEDAAFIYNKKPSGLMSSFMNKIRTSLLPSF